VSVTGDPLCQPLYLYDADGLPLTYATKADLLSAGWGLTWYDGDAVALVDQPTWSMPEAGVDGRHLITFVNPDGAWTTPVAKPTAEHLSIPVEFSGEGVTYDTNALGAMIQSSEGITVVGTLTTSDDSTFHGDSIGLDFGVSESALAAIGATSLDDCDSIDCEIKKTSTSSTTAAEVGEEDFDSVEPTADSPGDRVVRAEIDEFPEAIAPPTGGQSSLACRADLRLTKGTKTIIGSVINLTIKWRANAPTVVP
jgi:hypothetical protein